MMACGGGGLDQTSVARQSVHALCIYARLTLVYFLNCIFTISHAMKKGRIKFSILIFFILEIDTLLISEKNRSNRSG